LAAGRRVTREPFPDPSLADLRDREGQYAALIEDRYLAEHLNAVDFGALIIPAADHNWRRSER